MLSTFTVTVPDLIPISFICALPILKECSLNVSVNCCSGNIAVASVSPISDIVTVVVSDSSQNGIFVQFGKKNLSILIKKNQLAKEVENQRPSRFVKGDKLDVLITELDKEKRKVSLSIKALEEKQTKEAVKKYGSKDSGGILGEILEPLLKKKPKTKK